MDGITLSRKWNVPAKQAHYSKTGNWYHRLTSFPSALFDPNGYLFFKTEEDYLSCQSLRINQDIWVSRCISSDPAYVQILIDGSEYIPEKDTVDYTNSEKVYFEGTPVSVSLTIHERDINARAECLKKHGYLCAVCSFDFHKTYGTIGIDMIHVHHLNPVSSFTAKRAINPINDLRPVCPNCHAIIHRRQPPFSIEEVQRMILIYRQINI